ncbi:hypothetical protein GQS52_09460 [Streptomyces sp. SCUT-3]|nr:hypothetical protein C0036_15315 [Streptomyces sp. DJ]QMV21970.1 hypothetical protein GQS52_09460 [Streptomyces sp. SCUT-3]
MGRDGGTERVPTAIGATGEDLVLPATDRQTPAAVVLGHPEQQPLDRQLADVTAVLDHYGHLVVVVPSWLPAPARQRLHTVRSILESDRIALVESDLPPLAVAVLVQQLRQLSLYDLGPGVLGGAVRLLSHYVHAGALLGSVARLDRVEVDFRSHLKSYVPGRQFAVLANPSPLLLEADGNVRLPGPDFSTHLTFGARGTGGEWVRERLAPQWRPQLVREVALPEWSGRWWGTGKVVEFAAHIPDVGVLYQLVASVRRENCGWCGLELIGDRCPFCAAPVGPPAPSVPSVTTVSE